MSAMPDIGVISYNGVTFPAETGTTAASVRPVYDPAGRTVTASKTSLTIKTTLSTAALEATVEDIVVRLTHPGMPFVYRGRGLPLTINTGPVSDVAFGPQPRMIDYEPLGGN